MENDLIPVQNLIYEIRGYKVMLDSDLAKLYGIETKNLNKAVKRNIERFPNDFMFQLSEEEYKNLKFQIGTSKEKHGGRRTLPYVFTEQGIAMLSSVLQSKQAISINIQIMRTFVQIKRFALENKQLTKRLIELEHYFIQHCKENKADMKQIYDALNLLMDRTKPSKIGFKTED